MVQRYERGFKNVCQYVYILLSLCGPRASAKAARRIFFNSHNTCALGQSKFMKSYIENSSKSTLIFVKNLKKFNSRTFF